MRLGSVKVYIQQCRKLKKSLYKFMVEFLPLGELVNINVRLNLTVRKVSKFFKF